MQLYQGVVENRNDPLKLGRCQVRVVGLHTHDKVDLPTEDLPWAYPMQPVTSAAMSGIGYSPVGPVEGTWVVIMFRDADEQYPIILGTIGGIPQQTTSIDSEPDNITLKDYDDSLTTSNVVTTSNEPDPVKTSELTPQQQAQNVLQPGMNTVSDIPTVPPPDWKGDVKAASNGIKALLAACDAAGFTTKEQKCSVLAIAGGESGWIPQEELYSYSADGLRSTFNTTFVKNNPLLVDDYTRAPKKGMSRETFFNFVYAPENNGKQLGNTQIGDGGKFYGRGFIQLTGRANYTKYGSAAGVDLINNPQLLNDLTTGAKVAVEYIKDRTSKKVSTSANPEYFYAVKSGIGHDTGTGAEVRLKYYEYFYGNKTTLAEDKSPEPVASPTEPSVYNQASPSSGNGPIGFKDPNNKYPLKNFINEPDTNRLARGIKQGTIHPIKDSRRALDIPKALSNETYDEPASSYAAQYPYNHVLETESGHVQEWDDTPGHERTLTYHRKGTFTEVDANGSEVHHIVGDGYTIIDRNGCIFITGEANLTVNGNINIFSKANVNLEVTGDLTATVGGDYTLGVAGDMTVAVGGSYKVQSEGSLFHQSNSELHSVSLGNLYYSSSGDINLKANGNFNMDATRVDLSDGKSIPATSINLVAPQPGVVSSPSLPYLVAPVSEGESVFLLETEEEWASPAGKSKIAELEKQYGPPPEANDSATPTGGSNAIVVATCDIVQGTENFANDFRLSPNFTLGMLIDGGINGKNKLRDQNGLTKQQIVCNLSQLCTNILEPMLSVLPGGIGGYGKQWKINSGYRISSNIPAGGVAKSDHMLGRAIDFTLLPYDSSKAERNFNLAQQIEKILPYDQMIMEFLSGGSNWIHISYRGSKEGDTTGGGINRKMAFTMVNGKTYKVNGKTGFYLI
jgi:predicted chitinase